MNLNARFFNTNNFLLLANLLLLTCFFCQLQNIGTGNYFNSDSLYLPSVYRDLFVDKNALAGWHFNGAPNFFPDMFVYFILMFFSGNTFIYASFIFSFLQYFFLFYLLVRLYKSVVPDSPPRLHSIIYLVQTIWLLEVFYLATNFIFVYFLLSNSYHTGSFVMALCCFLLVMNFFKEPSTGKLIFLFILVFISAFSDKLFIILFILPLGITGLAFIRSHFKKIITVVPLAAISAGFSRYVFDLINAGNYIHFYVPDTSINAQKTQAAYDMFFHFMREYTLVFGFRTIGIYLFLLSIACLLFLFFRKRKTSGFILNFFILFIISQSVIVISAPVIIGNFTGYDTLRYNIYPVYLTGLNLAVFAAIYIRWSPRTITAFKYVMLAFTTGLFIAGFFNFNVRGLGNYFSYYPETAKRLDDVAEKEGLKNGVGNYWVAKEVTMFSKKGVKVYAVFDGLVAYTAATNDNWFFNENSNFNFVLLNGFADTTLYRKKLLQSSLLYNESSLKLLKTNNFGYDRLTYGLINK